MWVIELTFLLENANKIFNANDLKSLQDNILQAVLQNDFEKHKLFVDVVQDLSVDWLQIIYQYYFADRKENKQDFTPKTIAKLAQKLSQVDNEKVVYDMCCGSGALTIQKWNAQKGLHFVLKELSEDVVPFLLFNLSIRNISATLMIGDVLQDSISKVYKVIPTETYGIVATSEESLFTADTCISNPPFNIKWDIPFMAQAQPRFYKGVPPKSNANFAFILTALEQVKEKAVFILPNGVLSSDTKEEKAIRQELIESNLFEAVIILPDSMFEATSIPTCVLVFNKNKVNAKVQMIDLRKKYDVEVREQRGQFGGTSHTNRVYKKEVKILSDNLIDEVLQLVKTGENIPEYTKSVTIADIKSNDYNITPSRYIEFEEKSNNRDLNAIISDLNKCIAQKNACKLTINENLARSLGFDVSLYKKDASFDDLNATLEKSGFEKIAKENHISLTKNKNEIIIANGNKDDLSHIMMFALQGWKQHMRFMNEQENRLLAELRDSLLPLLMSGELEVHND